MKGCYYQLLLYSLENIRPGRFVYFVRFVSRDEWEIVPDRSQISFHKVVKFCLKYAFPMALSIASTMLNSLVLATPEERNNNINMY